MGEHNAGRRRHPGSDDEKRRRILALLDGREILEPGPDFVARHSAVGEQKYHIANLAYDATEPELRKFCSSIGTITELHIFIDYNTGRSRGFAVLRICGDASVLNGATFQGRELRVERWDGE